MEMTNALEALTALSHETRLWVFRLLVQAGPEGLPAGEIADTLSSRQNTMSSHLAVLERAGLISSERQGRSIVYRAGVGTVRDVTRFLVNDCCGGRPELCAPLVADFTPCCTPKETADGCC